MRLHQLSETTKVGQMIHNEIRMIELPDRPKNRTRWTQWENS